MATSRTSKTGIRIYVSNSGMGWISAFPPGNTACGNVSACADWAIAQFRKGAVSAVSRLDVHERGCHILKGRLQSRRRSVGLRNARGRFIRSLS